MTQQDEIDRLRAANAKLEALASKLLREYRELLEVLRERDEMLKQYHRDYSAAMAVVAMTKSAGAGYGKPLLFYAIEEERGEEVWRGTLVNHGKRVILADYPTRVLVRLAQAGGALMLTSRNLLPEKFEAIVETEKGRLRAEDESAANRAVEEVLGRLRKKLTEVECGDLIGSKPGAGGGRYVERDVTVLEVTADALATVNEPGWKPRSGSSP